jgi:protein SCO1/2
MVLAIVAVLAATGIYAAWSAMPARPAFHGTTYDPVAPAADFRLRGSDGQEVTLASYRGRPLLLFFGYTRCTDFCPLTLDRLSRAVRELGDDAGGARIVLVTVDPAHDTPAVLARYVSRFGAGIDGLSGDSAALAAAWRAYGVYIAPKAQAAPAAGHEHHAMGMPNGVPPELAHSGVVYGIDRRGDLRVVITDGAPAADVRDDIRALARL